MSGAETSGVSGAGGEAPSAPVRVLVVDDDPLVRSALAMVLSAAPDVEVVGQAGDGDEAVEVAAVTDPDVVLMDVRMPRRDGISATAELVAAGSARVVVLTTFAEDDAVLAALRAGASGFLVKDTPPLRIVEAVRQAAAGETTVSPAVVRRLVGWAVADGEPVGSAPAVERRQRARSALAGLSARERDVALAVGRGCTNAEVAAQLHLSPATVKAHLSRAMEKLRVTNRVQVAITVHDAGSS